MALTCELKHRFLIVLRQGHVIFLPTVCYAVCCLLRFSDVPFCILCMYVVSGFCGIACPCYEIVGSSLPLIRNWCHASLHNAQLGSYLHRMRS
jgi:hypothetical protein